MQGQYSYAAMNALATGEGNYASRDANGNPFPLYKQPAYYFTDYTSSGNRNSYYNLARNLPTNTVMANNAMQSDGVSQANMQNYAMVNRTQTLETNKYPQGATSPNDPCGAYPGTKPLAAHIDWNDSKGNQTTFCSSVHYPEMINGQYYRLSASQGGIGKACVNDNECGQNYFCNNETNMFGKNRQATGFCSQVFICPDGSKHFSGYPYNSGEPIPPPSDQNNFGKGYDTKEQCNDNLRGYQDCVQNANNKWFAVFTQYCPMEASLRKSGNPVGALSKTPVSQKQIIMPGWGNQGASQISAGPQAFYSWNINSEPSKFNEDKSPLAYSLSINPRG